MATSDLSAAIDALNPADPVSSQDAQAAMDLAQRILDSSQGINAIPLFDRLLAKAPIKPVFACMFVAVFNLQLGDLRRAGFARSGPDGKVGLTFPTDDGAAWLAVGRHFTRLGDFARALDALQKAAALRPHCHATACFFGQMLVTHRRYDEADEVFGRAAGICGMFVATTRFSESFWAGVSLLGDEQPPDVSWIDRPPARPRAALLLSCDSAYFHRYAQRLVRSWRRRRALKAAATDEASWLIHFHLVHPDAAALERIQRWRADGLMLAATMESPRLPPDEILDAPRFCHVPTYYASARLRVAPWLLRHYRVPVVISDLDMTLIGDPERVLSETAGADVGLLRFPPQKKPLWEEFWLSLLVLRPTEIGRQYGILHASYTEYFLRRGALIWTLDQAGQYSALVQMQRLRPEARILELPLDLIIAQGSETEKPDAPPVFANAAASMSYRSQDQLAAALNEMPPQEIQALSALARKRTGNLKRFWERQHGSRVIAGPFAGMSYHDRATEDCYLPKVLGSFEQEIQPVIRTLRTRALRSVINIGCGDGYYAVGLARMLKLPVLAIDTKEESRAACARLAAMNGVADLVEVSSREVSAANIGEIAAADSLLVINLDGAEKDLLAPEALSGLAACDLLIETQEGLAPDLSLSLCDRLEASHRVELIERRGVHSDLPDAWMALSDIDRLLSLWEFRTGPVSWLWARGKARLLTEPDVAT